MTELTAIPAAARSAAALAELFTRGYDGYFVPIHVDATAIAAMVRVVDLDLAASRVVLEGDSEVAFAMLGVRGARGWIGGMGVSPEARGRGLGRVALVAVLETARARGLESVDLEVLEQNTPAIRIYEALGFRDTRLLGVWSREPSPAADASPTAHPAVTELSVTAFLDRHPELDGAPSPWQRDRVVVERTAERIRAYGVGPPERPLALAAVRTEGPRTQVLDLTAAPAAEDACLEALVTRVVADFGSTRLMLINLPEGDRAEGALERAGFGRILRQREMRLALAGSSPLVTGARAGS